MRGGECGEEPAAVNLHMHPASGAGYRDAIMPLWAPGCGGVHESTICTEVPYGAWSKMNSALSMGMRMQPCEAG